MELANVYGVITTIVDAQGYDYKQLFIIGHLTACFEAVLIGNRECIETYTPLLFFDL